MEILLLKITLAVDMALILLFTLRRRRIKRQSKKEIVVHPRPYKMVDLEVCQAIMDTLNESEDGLTATGLISEFGKESSDFNFITNWEIKQNLIYLEMNDRIGCAQEDNWIPKTCSFIKTEIYYSKEPANRIFDY